MTWGKLGRRAWHLCLQVICFHRKPPSLRLTDTAKHKLLSDISRITDFEPVATVLWGSTTLNGVTRPFRWGVGFYDIGTRPYGRVTRIQGVPFVFTQDRAYTHLNGATLDYRDGRYVVTEFVSADVLEQLTPRERKVLKERFGIEAGADATLAEVAKQFDLTRAKIREIERRAREKLGSDHDPDESA